MEDFEDFTDWTVIDAGASVSVSNDPDSVSGENATKLTMTTSGLVSIIMTKKINLVDLSDMDLIVFVFKIEVGISKPIRLIFSTDASFQNGIQTAFINYTNIYSHHLNKY